MRPQRTIARTLASVCIAGGLLSLAAPSAHAEDDYPWAWQGQCPILPQAPIEEPTPTPAPEPAQDGPQDGDAAGDQPGDKPGDKAGEAAPVAEPPPPPAPVLDPLSGHLYDPRGPKPTCAKWVWSINGSIGDPWGFVWRNCTSFVAWRLQERNHLAGFSNSFGGRHWGNAENWDDVARSLGYRVDSVPAIGAVAQTDAGRVGHVAWVSAIGAGTVTIEEYNHSLPGGYGTRTVPVGDFRYLHLDDVAPSPLIGSDRPVVSVPDGLGESWTARVDDGGTLLVARPGRRARVVGTRGGFSPVVAPSLVLDRRGRPWVAATTRTGTVLAGTVRGDRFALRPVSAAAPTSSPALALSRTGRPVVAAVSPSGTLVTRRFTEQGRWNRPDRIGAAGSWSTHTAPVLGADGSGRTWLVAVTARGSTYATGLEKGRLARLAGPTASTTSTPALTVSGGTTRLHQVGADGRLTVRTLRGRRWGRPAALDGDWSPYSSPAVGEVAGRLVVAAVDRSGTLRLRAAVAGQRARLVAGLRSPGDPTRSAGLVTRRNGGVFVVAPGARRAPQARLLTRPASALKGDTSPTRGGFTP